MFFVIPWDERRKIPNPNTPNLDLAQSFNLHLKILTASLCCFIWSIPYTSLTRGAQHSGRIKAIILSPTIAAQTFLERSLTAARPVIQDLLIVKDIKTIHQATQPIRRARIKWRRTNDQINRKSQCWEQTARYIKQPTDE